MEKLERLKMLAEAQRSRKIAEVTDSESVRKVLLERADALEKQAGEELIQETV